ncbi:MAG: FMN-binding negative transcriptional regulator [Bacteroidota bacterium]
MYIPHHYTNTNLAEVKTFIEQNAFGILVHQVEGRPWGTHIPLQLEKDDKGEAILVGHIAKANPQGKYFTEDAEVLCIFNGPHAYVSSSWYQKEEVPTWNYIAVHVYGKLRVLDEAATMASLHRLVAHYEKRVEQPIQLENMSPKTLRQVKGVIGFTIAITEIQAAYKLSQTRPEDHEAILKNLNQSETADQMLAKTMERYLKNDKERPLQNG